MSGYTLAFVADSVGVSKDVRTSYTNQPKARVYLGIAWYRYGNFVRLGVDVEHEEAGVLSSFAYRSCLRQLELTGRKVDEMRADFLNATDRLARST